MKRKPSSTDLAKRNAQVLELLQQRHRELQDECQRLQDEMHQSTEHRSSEDDSSEQACLIAAEFLVHLRREMRDVTDALERARRGALGVCETCGAEINLTRLRAVPTARRCLDCQLGAEKRAS